MVSFTVSRPTADSVVVARQSFASRQAVSESNSKSYAMGRKETPPSVTLGPNLQSNMRSRPRLLSALLPLFMLTVTPFIHGQSSSTSSPSLPPQYLGSQPEGNATNEVLQIDFKEAIDRGLRSNLGALLASNQTETARGERWKELSELLPHISARIMENAQNESLAALGFDKLLPLFVPAGTNTSTFPHTIPAFNYFDARATLDQSVFNYHDFKRERASVESEKAAQFSYKDARETVVLAVGNAYLEAIAGAARVDTAEAQVKNAQALYDKAADQLKAGLIPAIDSLRAQVELQTRQQQLIVARNDLAKQRLSVARVIGLAPGQQFVLTETAPYQSLTALPMEAYLEKAYSTRPDYQAALAQVRAAELSRQSAAAGHLPTVDVSANYGDIGVTPAHSNGTWQVTGGVNIPIFAGNKTHSDVLEADAQLKTARSQLGDLRGKIDYEVRTALLDLNAAAEQVEVARSSVTLAEQALAQSQDRFTAGVADNLEVVQAQEALAGAHESYIQSLYAHNLAKVELAYSIGDAEGGVKRFLKGTQ